MHFLQSTRTCQKYFPELGPGEHEEVSAQPEQPVSRLAAEILQFTQKRKRSGGAVHLESFFKLDRFGTGVRGRTGLGLGFAHIAKLGVVCEDGSDVEGSSEDAGREKGRSSWNDMPKFLLAGAVSTVISRTCLAPLERIKVECIVQGSKHTWQNIVKCIWVSEGVKGFWKGNVVNLFRMVPFKSINFLLYDMYIDHLQNMSEKREIMNQDRLIGGGISGVVATVICIPLDTAMADPNEAACSRW